MPRPSLASSGKGAGKMPSLGFPVDSRLLSSLFLLLLPLLRVGCACYTRWVPAEVQVVSALSLP